MLDTRLLRSDLDSVVANLARRGFAFDKQAFVALEERRKALQVEVDRLRNERNTRSKSIGRAKAQGQDIAPLHLVDRGHLQFVRFHRGVIHHLRRR